jgi:hypothetical protein
MIVQKQGAVPRCIAAKNAAMSGVIAVSMMIVPIRGLMAGNVKSAAHQVKERIFSCRRSNIDRKKLGYEKINGCIACRIALWQSVSIL